VSIENIPKWRSLRHNWCNHGNYRRHLRTAPICPRKTVAWSDIKCGEGPALLWLMRNAMQWLVDAVPNPSCSVCEICCPIVQCWPASLLAGEIKQSLPVWMICMSQRPGARRIVAAIGYVLSDNVQVIRSSVIIVLITCILHPINLSTSAFFYWQRYDHCCY